MLTLPVKFETQLKTVPNIPSFIVKLIESETSVESTLEADWVANTQESNVDYDSTPAPPDAGDVILSGGANIGGSWTSKASGQAYAFRPSVLYNGKAYLFGGNSWNPSQQHDDVQEYDISGNSWASKTALPETRSLSTAVLYGSKVYIFGGTKPGTTYSNDIIEYDLVNFTYTTKSPTGDPPAGRYAHCAAIWGDKMYVWGGMGSSGRLNDLWVYDITNNTWAQLTSGRTASHYASMVAYNSKLYVLGGQLVSGYDNSLDEYDIATDSWTAKADCPVSMSNHIAVVIGDFMYTHGGIIPPNGYQDDVYAYSLGGNDWETKIEGGTVRTNHAAVAYNGKMYVFSGTDTNESMIATTYEDDLGYAASGYIRTKTLDSGSVPTVEGVFKFENLLPSGTSITYEAWASSTGAFSGEEVSIGTVVDGQITTVRLRYWRIKATLNANSEQYETPTLKSVMVRFPAYRAYSDNPKLGYEASLLSISALQTKIADFEASSIGQVTITLAFSKSISGFLKNNYPKNKEVSIFAGFIADGFTEYDYVLHYTGLVDNWKITDKDTVSISVKDFSKEWDVPVPAKWQSSSDDKTWTAMHPVDVMLDILRGHIGATDSRIDQNSFNDVKAATPGWVVTRTITGSTVSAKILLEELRRLLSAYFIPQPTGRIKLKQWTPSDSAVGTLTDIDMLNIDWDGNASALINRIALYYNHDGSGDEMSDFSAWDISVDATSIINWKEMVTEEIKDKWTASAQSAQVAARRTNILTRYANPPEIINVEVDYRLMKYETGDILNITTVRAPSTDMSGISNKPFQVVQQTPDFAKHKIKYKLLRRDSA